MDGSKQNAWNFASLFIYFILLSITGYFVQQNGFNINELSIKELVIIVLAIYRLTRIIVFEKIFKYFRDFVKARKNFKIFNTIVSIITCPWCAGVWVSLLMFIFYYLVPYGKLLVYILALAGVASFLILLSNLLALKVEEKQAGRKK